MSFPLTRTQTVLLMYLRDPSAVVPPYDHIEVFRGLTQEGPFEAITGPAVTKAAITAGDAGPYRLNGTVLSMELPSGALLDYAFTSVDPISATDAAAELNLANGELDCTVDADDKLVIRTLMTGNGACLKITGGDALWWLKIVENTTAFGLSVGPTLSGTTYIYTAQDLNGSLNYFYRYRLIDTAPPGHTELMTPVAVGRDLTVAVDKLSVGYIKVTESTGVSSNRSVHVANKLTPPSVAGAILVGDQVKRLDPSGTAEFVLLRGMKIEFYVPGSPLHRVITVPDLPSFDMLDPSLVADDPWGIIVPPYNALPRTTP